MIVKKSFILIYGICETPKIILDTFKTNSNMNAFNRQFIDLNDAPKDIRIGDRGWLEVTPDQLLQFEKNEDIFIFAKEMILSKTHPFSKPVRNALVSYLNWVEVKSIEFQVSNKGVYSDLLFSNSAQICYSAFLPLPHPKIPLCNKNGEFEGAANFDLGFHIAGNTYLISFSSGQFIPKSERELRQRLLNENDRLSLIELPKPIENLEIDQNYINNLISLVPEIEGFRNVGTLPHGLYYPPGLDRLN